MSSDTYKMIATAVVVLTFVAITLFVRLVRSDRGDRVGLGFLLLAVISAIGLGFALWNVGDA